MRWFLKLQSVICLVLGTACGWAQLLSHSFRDQPFGQSALLVTVGAIAWHVSNLRRESAESAS